MSTRAQHSFKIPPEQQAIRERCFHPCGTFVAFPREDVETSVPLRFERIVHLHPDHIAVEMSNESLTYAELNRAANRLANIILADKEPDHSPVAVVLPRGIAQAVAILAVLKAGRMFLLQDPESPDHDFAHVFSDAQPKLIVTSKHTESKLRGLEKLNLRSIDIRVANDGSNDQNPGVYPSPDSGAYIRYTSGSTSRAKGVVIPHRTILHGVMSYTNSSRFCVQDRLLEINSNTIRRMFFVHLLNGATLCPYDFNSDGLHELAAWMKRRDITIYRSFPGAFRSFMSLLSEHERFPKVRIIRLSGEPMYRSDVELFKSYFPSTCVLIHSYASSETGIICSNYLDHRSIIVGHRVPVGYPEEGKEVSIVDDEGKELPAGHSGEIVVKSSFLSSGYWRRPDENDLGFQTSRTNSTIKNYRTGDLGQLSADGCLTHLGRKDDRIKIRNFRVDLSEVEAKLGEHPEIKLAVVTAKEDSAGEMRLLAYFVSRNQPAPTVTALRDFLSATLAPYMVPAVFMELPVLPVTSTGKVNRRALPEPAKSRPNLAMPMVSPTTAVEGRLAAIWQEVLSLDQVGIHDKFLDLGGHSLAASKIIARVLQSFRLKLPVNALFESPTVAEMAAIVSRYQEERASDATIAQMLTEIEAMTEDEAQKTLSEKSG